MGPFCSKPQPVSRPWIRGTSFTWSLGQSFFLSLATTYCTLRPFLPYQGYLAPLWSPMLNFLFTSVRSFCSNEWFSSAVLLSIPEYLKRFGNEIQDQTLEVPKSKLNPCKIPLRWRVFDAEVRGANTFRESIRISIDFTGDDYAASNDADLTPADISLTTSYSRTIDTSSRHISWWQQQFSETLHSAHRTTVQLRTTILAATICLPPFSCQRLLIWRSWDCRSFQGAGSLVKEVLWLSGVDAGIQGKEVGTSEHGSGKRFLREKMTLGQAWAYLLK